MGPTPILEMARAYGLPPQLWLLILLTFGSIYTKLGDFVKLGLQFMTMWINSC